MIILDRVCCDCCGRSIGQLWNQPAQAPDLLPRLSDVVCPDCKAKELTDGL